VSTGRPEHLGEYLARAALRRPDHPALVVGALRLTWADVDRAADACAAGLASRGIAPGDRVGLFLGNRPELVTAYFGALRAGAVVVPLHPGLTAPEVRQLSAIAGLSLLVVDRATADVAADAAPDVPHVVAGAGQGSEGYEALLAAGSGGTVPAAPGGEAVALLIFTSGTSGVPKGAMLSHRALVASIEQVAEAQVPVATPDDVVLLNLPLSHVYSLAGTLGALVRVAATGVLVEGLPAGQVLRTVPEWGVTNIPGAPVLWAAWASDPAAADCLSGLRIGFSGSAALPVEVQQSIHAVTGQYLHEGYGLTEASPGVTSTVVSGVAKPGSVGRPLPGVEIRLVDEDGEDVDPADGDPGEIWIRGDNLFSGYWPDASGGPDADGWFATGDVGYLDDDGDLYIVDRRKDVVIVSGFNVYPHEVEAVLMQHPAVAEAAVVGIADAHTGEAVKAYVVLRDAGTTVDALQEHCAERLARFKRPKLVEVVDTLPHTQMGKLVRGRLDHGGGA
jgi:long-chain acyl-CoA synthetase